MKDGHWITIVPVQNAAAERMLGDFSGSHV